MKILVTGFDPFGGEAMNPAYEAVKLLPATIAGATIIPLEIPTVFRDSAKVVADAVAYHQPDVVLSIGQAGGRFDISVERVAINLMDGRIADNKGFQPIDEVIQEDGAAAYFATIPVKAMVKAIREVGIPSSVSYTAGSYVCNYIMYENLYLAQTKYPHIRTGFIHVPYALNQAVAKPVNTPTMDIAIIAKAISAAIAAIVTNDTDIKTVEGVTH
ncbi:MAG: pyroglutamyl-peptidase I [Erysipelotrichaceae bacterium]